LIIIPRLTTEQISKPHTDTAFPAISTSKRNVMAETTMQVTVIEKSGTCVFAFTLLKFFGSNPSQATKKVRAWHTSKVNSQAVRPAIPPTEITKLIHLGHANLNTASKDWLLPITERGAIPVITKAYSTV
jgi:hypothetical protein